MRDPIERQDVFDLLNSVSPYIDSWLIQYIDDAISSIPSAQPVEKDINVPCKDTISRQDAFDALDNIKIPRNASWYPYYQQALTAMSRLPSAYPETDSFCTDCKEYDSERHFCPRFDRVIKKTVEEMQIIHCKDCKHGELFTDQYLCRKAACWREGDFYCKGAERREE